MTGTKSIRGIETLEGKFPFEHHTKYISYWIIVSDSLGNIKRLANGSYINMKEVYLKRGYTPLDGYYIVEVESIFNRVVK